MPQEAKPVAICPGCKIQMRIKARRPLKPSTALEELVYECPQCGTETKRAIKQQVKRVTDHREGPRRPS
jgi:hypothetical protein